VTKLLVLVAGLCEAELFGVTNPVEVAPTVPIMLPEAVCDAVDVVAVDGKRVVDADPEVPVALSVELVCATGPDPDVEAKEDEDSPDPIVCEVVGVSTLEVLNAVLVVPGKLDCVGPPNNVVDAPLLMVADKPVKEVPDTIPVLDRLVNVVTPELPVCVLCTDAAMLLERLVAAPDAAVVVVLTKFDDVDVNELLDIVPVGAMTTVPASVLVGLSSSCNTETINESNVISLVKPNRGSSRLTTSRICSTVGSRPVNENRTSWSISPHNN